MKATQLVFLHPTGGDVKRLVVHNAPKGSPRCVLVIPGASVLARNVSAVGATPAQRRAAALAELAPDLAAATASLACDVAISRGVRLALVASRAELEGWLKTAREAGLQPDAIVPDYLLLPRPPTGVAHFARRDDVVVRTAQGGFACQPDLFVVLTAGLEPREIDFDEAVISGVRSGVLSGAPNVLLAMHGEKAQGPRLGAAWVAGALAAGLAAFSFAPWIDAWRLSAATTELRAETTKIARTALSDARRIVQPLAQLREAALPRQRTQAQLANAAGLLEGLSRAPNVTMARLELGEDGVVRASLSMPDLAQLQPLRDHLAEIGLKGSETPGTSSVNQLNVELSVGSGS